MAEEETLEAVCLQIMNYSELRGNVWMTKKWKAEGNQKTIGLDWNRVETVANVGVRGIAGNVYKKR